MQPKRTFDLLTRYQEKFPGKTALVSKKNGEWIPVSIEEYIQKTEMTCSAFMELGLQKGDKIATISNNRPEWNYIDMASASLGIVHVPIYPTISKEDLTYILKHSKISAIFISSKEYYDNVSDIIKKCESTKSVFSFDIVNSIKNYSEFVELGKNAISSNKPKIKKIRDSINSGDLLSLIYTSGTTGKPKGAMISHGNIMSNTITVAPLHHLDYRHSVLSFLPLSHIFERMFHYLYLYLGITVYYAENLNTIADNLRELKVNGFLTVPRLLEKIFDRFMTAGKKLPFIKKAVFMWAVNLGLRYKISHNNIPYKIKLKIANILVFKKLREALGDNISFVGCGGASLQSRLERIFHAAGIPVFVGYGLTETSPVLSVNYGTYPNIKLNTVGLPLSNCDIKIDIKGEILVKGPMVIESYYKDDELNRQSFNNQGWFRTGDKGIIRDDGFLVITGRLKEIFKTSGAKYIAPEKIENFLKESMFIENAMVVGENKKFPSAFIIPNFIYLHDWCTLHNIKYRDNEKLILMHKVVDRYKKEVEKCNKSLGQSEKIKVFRLLSEEWNTKTGELTPTLKLKRKYIKSINIEIFDDIYKGKSEGST